MKKALVCSLALAAAAVSGAEPDAEGFVTIFNGKDLSGWIGATDTYRVEDGGVLACCPPDGGNGKRGNGGNLVTEKQYENFILRFEFCMPTNANNGLGIRMPSPEAHGAYEAMCELQILDDGGDKYEKLKPYQFHGSLYGIAPSRRDNIGKQIWGKEKNFAGRGSFLKKAGLWNFEEVRVIGSRIQVILNGVMITDADVSKFKGDGDTPDGKKHPGLHRKIGHVGWLGHGHHVQWRNIRIKEVAADYVVGSDTYRPAPAGFTTLFNGRNLENWKGVTREERFDNPLIRRAATPEKRAEMQKIADAGMIEHWTIRDGALFFDGFKGGYSLATVKDYGDFEMWVDWRIMSVTGDSGLYLRGCPQVQIWDAHNQWHIGSGGLYNNKKNPSSALSIQDRLVGSWNRFHITMRGERVTVELNGVKVVDDTVLENYWDRTKPIFPAEQIELQCHGDPIEFKNIFIREL